jgi:hypothetical protein
MTMIKLAIAVLVTVGLTGMPFAAQAKKHKPVRHNISTVQPATYEAFGTSKTPSGTYGTSGTSVGTVTAPSVGSYSWPSVGVTNAVPTWSNTNPHVGR